MKRLCIYSTPGKQAEQARGRYVVFALKKYKEACDRLVVVTDIDAGHPLFEEIRALADVIVRSPKSKIQAAPHGYRLGLAAVDAAELESYDEIVFTDSRCYGPVFPIGPILDDPQRRTVDLWSIGFSEKTRMRGGKDNTVRTLTWDFFTVNRRVVASSAFRKFMRKGDGFLTRLYRGIITNENLHLALEADGFKWTSFIQRSQVNTAEPLLFETAELLRLGCPIISQSIFTLDPLELDMRAVDCRAVMQALAASGSDFKPELIWESLLPYYPLRLLQSNFDDLRILPAGFPEAQKRQWNLGGKIAVIAHIYYVEMLPEFIELVSNIPGDFDFFATTSSEDNRKKIEAGLQAFQCGGRKEVRIVEQNRGRDMSSLFITFRDVVLNGEYAWILRLHSKRTPQVSWQIGQSFKRHLIDNLLPSRQFVQSLFDLLEQEEYRNVGVVTPPIVHIAFGTLGHSWYSNRKPVEKIAKELKIDVPLDEATPVAAYGTMYWFRPQALAPMFRHEWKWEAYNAEPHHSDGGLAHAQERLICYCAQQQGFRTLAIMSSEQAARNYVKLEYKHQAIASSFPIRDVRQQYKLAKATNWKRSMRRYSRFLAALERFDERFHKFAPKLWERTRAIVDVVWPMLKGLEK
jgi:rhamnosyltransferase